jgi:hypothetical protein
MAYKYLPVRGRTVAQAAANSLVIAVDSALYAALADDIDFDGGDYTYLLASDGTLIEEIKVTGLTDPNILVVERGQSDLDAELLSVGTLLTGIIGKAAVEDIAAGIIATPDIDILGTGAIDVSDDGEGTFTIGVTAPIVTAGTGVNVDYDNETATYEVSLASDAGCCNPDTGTGTGDAATITGAGLVEVSTNVDGEVEINVPTPNFTGDAVTVSGVWPDLEINLSSAAGDGTVTSVGATSGLSITGDPTSSPVISMDNTGIDAGDYGDISFNARGQVTEVAGTFNPVSSIVGDAPITTSRAGGEYTIGVVAAAEGVVGVVALADAGDPLDDADVTTAVTPALLAAVIADIAGVDGLGGQTFSGESDADYTNTVPTTAFALTLASGQVAQVHAELTVKDGGVPTDPVNYGMAIFSVSGAARIQSNKKVNQCQQSMTFLITGPFSDGLALKTTALPVGSSVISSSLTVLVLNG